MKLVALYVASEEDKKRYEALLNAVGIRVSIYVASKDKQRSPMEPLPQLYTKHDIYYGENDVACALRAYKEFR
jgi:hypothetical protein